MESRLPDDVVWVDGGANELELCCGFRGEEKFLPLPHSLSIYVCDFLSLEKVREKYGEE